MKIKVLKKPLIEMENRTLLIADMAEFYTFMFSKLKSNCFYYYNYYIK